MKKSLPLFIGAIGTFAFLPLIAIAASNERTSSPVTINAQCMQQASNVRGSALINIFDIFHDAVSIALKDRISAESNAWGESDVKIREKALRDASKSFDEAYRNASKELERQKNTAWQQFTKDSQACRTKPSQVPVCTMNEIHGSRGAYFQCYDGVETKRSTEACQSSDSWQKIGQEFCKGHCSKESGKCGVNTFAAFDLCSKSCPAKKCVAYCPDGTKYDSCVQYFADPCMNHGSSSSSNQTTEQVKCVFSGTTTEQKCYTATEAYSPLAFGCSGFGTCVADVKGPKGTALTWKSTCGGYAYTTLDGNSEYAIFSCSEKTTPKN